MQVLSVNDSTSLMERSDNLQKLTERKKIDLLIGLCTMAYLISYVTRVNLSATMVEINRAGLALKTTTALALTVCSVTYGVGQVLSGWVCDRYKPHNLILLGFAVAAGVNLLVGWMPHESWLVPLWGINGFAQAMMWPPMVRILSAALEEEDYRRACVRISWGSSVGTMLVYLTAPLLIGLGSVRWVFFACAASACLMLAAWKLTYDRNFEPVTPAVRQKQSASGVPMGRLAAMLMGAVFLGIVLQGFLRDGVTNWMPSYVCDVFHLDSTTSILSGVVLPVFAIVCLGLSSNIQRRLIKNELLCAAMFFGLACLSAAVLALCSSMGVSLLCLALLVGCMHGVNFMLVGMVPRYFERFGRVGLVSGVLNAGTYVGSAVSAYGTALYTEAFGWQSTALLWGGVAAGAVVLCVAVCSAWGRFKKA